MADVFRGKWVGWGGGILADVWAGWGGGFIGRCLLGEGRRTYWSMSFGGKYEKANKKRGKLIKIVKYLQNGQKYRNESVRGTILAYRGSEKKNFFWGGRYVDPVTKLIILFCPGRTCTW